MSPDPTQIARLQGSSAGSGHGSGHDQTSTTQSAQPAHSVEPSVSSAAASSVSDYNNLTGPAVQALLDAAGPLGPEVEPYNCRTSTGQITLSAHKLLFLQILKASEIVQKAFQVSAASHSSPHAGNRTCNVPFQ